jgi:hydroxymethylbilane synthase
MKYKVGTRDSKLALVQAELVCKSLVQANPELSIDQFELVKIKTIGDKILTKDLSEIGGKNLFIKEIEEALLQKKIDFAVHSLKDMTAKLDEKLVIAACLEREDPRDAFVSLKYKSLKELPQGSLIGTSSIRRKYIALHYRSDLKTTAFRGNVLTRLEKLKQGQVEATFLAVAGLKRLDIDESFYTPLELDEFLPSMSQGVIGVECQKDNKSIYDLLRSINHLDTEYSTKAERGFLECVDADCNSPIAAYATIKNNIVSLDCLVIDNDGKFHKTKAQGPINEAYDIGYKAGLELREFL